MHEAHNHGLPDQTIPPVCQTCGSQRIPLRLRDNSRGMAQMTWYRKSLSGHDTHRGHLRRGGVPALCGVEFSPLRAERTRSPALPGEPPSPDQTCTESYRRP